MKKGFILLLLILLLPFSVVSATFYLGIDMTGALIPYVGIGINIDENEGILRLGIAIDNTALVVVPSVWVAKDIDQFHLEGGVKFVIPLGYGKNLTLIGVKTAYNFNTFMGIGRLGLEADIPVFSEVNRFAIIPSLFAELDN